MSPRLHGRAASGGGSWRRDSAAGAGGSMTGLVDLLTLAECSVVLMM